jgi:hypothetical protein
MKIRFSLLLGLLAAPLTQATADSVEDRWSGFLLPSGNIACQFLSDGEASVLRCDIMKMTKRARRPADCDLEWGDAFEISATAVRGERICHGDTVMDRSQPVLAYGSVWQRDGFTCKSEQSGLTCFNAARHGFTISRAAQSVF